MVIARAAIAMVASGQAGRRPQPGTRAASRNRSWLLWLGLAFVAQGSWEIVLRSTRSLPDDSARLLFVTGTFVGAALLSGASAGVIKAGVRMRSGRALHGHVD